jgi:hypothetical protein
MALERGQGGPSWGASPMDTEAGITLLQACGFGARIRAPGLLAPGAPEPGLLRRLAAAWLLGVAPWSAAPWPLDSSPASCPPSWRAAGAEAAVLTGASAAGGGWGGEGMGEEGGTVARPGLCRS